MSGIYRKAGRLCALNKSSNKGIDVLDVIKVIQTMVMYTFNSFNLHAPKNSIDFLRSKQFTQEIIYDNVVCINMTSNS